MASKPGLSHDADIDLEWLKTEIQELFARNRVIQQRSHGCSNQQVTFHAPYLNSRSTTSSSWIGRFWYRIKAPSRVSYPHQWFWDSCAHAIVLSHFDIELAEKEIKSLLCAQDEEGFIPHMIWNPERMHWGDRWLKRVYRSEIGSPLLQPPVIAQAVEQVYQTSGDVEFLNAVLPSLQKYYLYVDRVRNRTGDGLPQIISSYESGKDRSPEYDEIYGESSAKPAWRGPLFKSMFRYWRLRWDIEKIFASNCFRVKDLLFCCIYAQNLAAMSRLCDAVGDREDSVFFNEKLIRTETSILNKMYDPQSGLFYSLDARHDRDRPIRVSTVSSLLPIILDTITKEQVERIIHEYLINTAEFWAEYPVPVNPLGAKQEKTRGHIVWRGKETWFYTNWYLVTGLRKQAQRFPEHGTEYERLAHEITLKTYQLIRQEGFREYYDATTGEGGGAFDFGWSTLVIDMLCPMDI